MGDEKETRPKQLATPVTEPVEADEIVVGSEPEPRAPMDTRIAPTHDMV